MKSLYSASLLEVPESLTRPSKKFKKQVGFAIFGLLLFIITYFGLMIWFGYTSYRLFASLGMVNDHRIKTVIFAVIVGFLAILMVKSLFGFTKKDKNKLIYVSKKEEPLLYDFVNSLADQAKAPRPHKIILSGRVNASVFYDLTILNLLFPTRKNLEIGLGLVNVLNLGELKAVLAHEFGHFAQRSMVFGRYVYMANQIASRIVNKRDALDSFLAGISVVDIRVAWIGWILSILVWAIRALVEVLFSVVVVAERALSREMEFQADLVAVSLTGSDSLINGLYKLKGADEAFHQSLKIVEVLFNEQKQIPDLFELQTHYIEKIRTVINDPSFANTPPEFKPGVKSKIFTSKGIKPPEMWATHPADEDREENAKRTYIPSEIDGRSCWELFENPAKERSNQTELFYKTIENLPKLEFVSGQEAIDKMDAEFFNWSFLDHDYQGLYMEHQPTLCVEHEKELFSEPISEPLTEALNKLYPARLKSDLETLKNLILEKAQLESTQAEVLTTERRAIYFRGDRITRKAIPSILKSVDHEIEELHNQLSTHDKFCHSVYHKVAITMGPEYSKFHKDLLGMLHYTEHSCYNLNDLLRKFQNSLMIASAGGRVSQDQMMQLLLDANELKDVMQEIYDHVDNINVDGLLSKKFEEKSYQDRFEKFGLGKATPETINLWLQHLNGWYVQATSNLWLLRNATLERLLTFEKQLEIAYVNNEKFDLINSNLAIPNKYKILVIGDERHVEFKLTLWDRFMAGYGLVPMTLKFIISAIIIGLVIFFSNGIMSFKQNVHIYNGLETSVLVQLDDKTYTLLPQSSTIAELDHNGLHSIRTTTESYELIEELTVKTNSYSRDYIYNVAHAAYLYKYTVTYGFDHNQEDVLIGISNWVPVEADYIFISPPDQLMLQTGASARKEVVTALTNISPLNYPVILGESETNEMIINHCLWDTYNSTFFYHWLSMAAQVDPTFAFLKTRENRVGLEVATKRIETDYGNDSTRAILYKELADALKKDSNNADIYYLKARMTYDSVPDVFERGYEKWPNHPWLTMVEAQELADDENWKGSLDLWLKAVKNEPIIGNIFAVEIHRIRRIVDPAFENFQLWSSEVDQNPDVQALKSLDRGGAETSVENPLSLFYFLSQGDFNYVENHAEGFEMKDVMAYYLATSEEYYCPDLSALLNQKDSKGLNSNTIWMAIGLRLKHNMEVTDLIDLLVSIVGLSISDVDDFQLFVDNLKLNQLNACEAIFNKIKPCQLRSRFALVGLIYLEYNTPDKWKFYVDKYLFLNEKPYLPSAKIELN